jgi:2-polyprenyl-3-methyl-5-hydroxy-6-metoxy-1,4-benzoquinol methylase
MTVARAERDTDTDWRAIAEADPYWGVLSIDRYRGQQLAEDQQADFFKTGEAFVESVVRDARAHFDKHFAPTRSMDFGCGVGRLLIPMARHTEGETVGVDVAPKMLAIAQRHVEQSNLSNVALILGDDELSNVRGDFDLINSFIVFQHIPPTRGYAITSKLLSLLRPQGVASLHYTFAKARKHFMHESGAAAFYRRDGGTIHDLLPTPPKLKVGSVHMFDYDLNSLMALFAVHGITGLIAKSINHDGHLGVHFIFRRGP